MNKGSIVIAMMFVLIFTLSACGRATPGEQVVSEEEFSTLVASTLTAVAEQAVLTEQAKPTMTLPPATETPANTQTPQPTATSQKVMLSVTSQTNCRKGPSTYFQNIAYLMPGGEVIVLGKTAAADWYYVQVPNQTAGGCWVSSQVLEGITGDTAILPVFTAQPTIAPSKTKAPQPVGSFSFSYVGYGDCNGGVAPKFSITNNGKETLQSVKIWSTMTDVDPAIERIFRSNTFGNNEDLAPGESASFLACDSDSHFPMAITGHTLRAQINICLLNEMNGDCQSAAISFKP